MKGKGKNMTDIRKIIHRLRMGQSNRLIHRELKVHRSMIRELHRLAIVHEWLNPELPMPTDADIAQVWFQKNESLAHHPLDIYREQFEQWNREGLSSVVIHQLLSDRCPCDVQVIRRYRNKHFPKPIQPVMVRFTEPGKHAEIDFGELGRFCDENGKVKRVWLFSFRLRHSRNTYREVVLDQTLQTFLMGHVHAFEYFNGVSANLICDNLKAAVIRSTIDNDMINRSYQELAEHYGCLISPCLPRTPEHKGGVEGDIKYCKKNFLAYFLAKQKEQGIEISKICDLIQALEKWNKEVAEVHLIHGVGRSPLEIFNSEEMNALLPLPKKRWEPTSWNRCTVQREWRIMLNCAYYSVPHHLIGKIVEVCVRDTFVRIFYENKEVALHEMASEKWEYKRRAEHAPPLQEAVLQCTRDGLLILAKDIGPFTYEVAHAILSHPSVDKLKPVRHLLRLVLKYSQERVENACKRAVHCKLFSYANIKNILANNLDVQAIDVPHSGKIILLPRYRFARNPADYNTKTTFEEQLERLHNSSKHGTAMQGIFNSLIADQIIEDHIRQGQEEGHCTDIT
jgi:Integrase core domain